MPFHSFKMQSENPSSLLPNYLIFSKSLFAVMIDLQEKILESNQLFKSYFSYLMPDFMAVTFDSLIHQEDVDIFRTAIQDVLSKKEHIEVIFRLKEYPYEVKWEIAPSFDSKETRTNLLVLGYVLSNSDTDTDIYKALIESEERYSSVVSAIGEGLVVQDMNDKIIMCNQAAADILGLTLNQLKGKDSYDPRWQALKEDGTPFPPEEHPTMITLRTGQPVSNVLMNVHTGEGQRKYIIINSRPVLNYKKEMYGAVASFRDITAQKIAEQQLMKINQELLDYQQLLRKNLEELYASQAKVELQKKILEEEIRERVQAQIKIIAQNEILRDIAWHQSHTIRRPVATILGLLNLMLMEGDSKPTQEESYEYLVLLSQTAVELDTVIRNIVRKINETEIELS